MMMTAVSVAAAQRADNVHAYSPPLLLLLRLLLLRLPSAAPNS